VSTLRFAFLTALAGIAVGVALTWPLALHLDSAVLEDGTLDAFQFLWNVWWVRESIVELGAHPFWTRYIYYPGGVPLLFHTGSFTLGLVSIPLQVAAGLVPAHNLLVIAAPALLFVAVAFLAREATGDPWAALVGGALGTLTPFTFWVVPVIYLSHAWIPPALLALWWSLQRRRSWALVAAALALLAASVFVSQEYAVIGMAVLGLDVLVRLALADRLAMPRLWVAGSAAFSALAGALLGALAVVALLNPAQPPGATQGMLYSGYLVGFVTPPWLLDPPTAFSRVYYLGTVTLPLCALGLWLAPRRAAYWALLALPLLLMVMGPVLHLEQPRFESGSHGAAPDVPGLYALAGALFPLFKFLRAPVRWMTSVNPVVAVLGAVGVAALRLRMEPASLRAAATGAIGALAVGVAFIDHADLRAPLVAADVPQPYEVVARDRQPAALLELPSGLAEGSFAAFSSRYMYYQTAHRKFLLYGTVSRLPRGSRSLLGRHLDDFARVPFVKYVVVHRDLVLLANAESRAQAEEFAALATRQGRLVASDAGIDLYELDTFRPETVRFP
jgi:hypothetical protein